MVDGADTCIVPLQDKATRGPGDRPLPRGPVSRASDALSTAAAAARGVPVGA